jgi:hypothetical protein
MVLTAIPLFLKVNLPTKQKLILMLVFGMGIFIIVAGILTKIYCLVPGLVSYVYMNWYFREATISMLVTSLPMIWSLVREFIPAIDSWVTPSSGKTSGPSRFRTTNTGNLTANHDVHLQKFDRLGSQNQVSVTVANVTPKDDDPVEISDDDHSDRALRVRQDVSFTIEYERDPHAAPSVNDSVRT